MSIIRRPFPSSPWQALISFLVTVVVATVEHWSPQDLAWSFWLAGLVLGLIYLAVYQITQRDRETLLIYPFFLLFFYFLFAGFLDTAFAFIAFADGGTMLPLFAGAPAAIARAARQRWFFLLTSGLALLPDYIRDARTGRFTDLSKPLFAKETDYYGCTSGTAILDLRLEWRE